eukprot:Gregarina_sp_Poly_1__10906@NODE_851_length_5972_cov_76_800339_g615_i0_p2_GENE_NODE_851_length_5972_cov_76_800339_g615_i0NODE_851_length_5972_cov_76_800339_g615_i0_p2_ORF_typecomplete_len718_score75_13SPA/PF08616_10/2_7e13Avl9/PF09794_9/0_00016Avl9/PF09794_9/3_7e02DENN/PF02141_21/2_6e02DENN/PF02141_21/0_033_NODE_851_length_5972_cov_76_800339_g615_i038065959
MTSVVSQLPSPSKTEAYSLFEPQILSFLTTSTPLKEWIRAFAYVEFLSDEGHKLSAVYPPDALTLDEAQRVTKLALPSGDKVTLSATARQSSFAFQIPGSSLYGFSHFVVASRGRHIREWTQNAVVVLTPLPHFDFFTALAGALSQKISLSEERPEIIFSLVSLTIALAWKPPPALAPVSVSIHGPGLDFEYIVPATHAHSSDEISRASSQAPDASTDILCDKTESGTSSKSSAVLLDNEEFYSAEEDNAEGPSHVVNTTKRKKQSHRGIIEETLRQSLAQKGYRGTYTSELSRRTKSEPLLIDPRFFGHSPEVSVFDPFKEILPCLLVIWETMITAEPFLIFGQEPSRVSRAVLAAKSLIAPLTFMGDCRPLVDTYEPDFDVLTSPSKFLARYGSSAAEPRPATVMLKPSTRLRRIEGAIFGTTNPMVLNTLASNVPAVLALDVPRNSVYIASRVRTAQSFVVDRSSVSESASQPATDIRFTNNSIQVLFSSLITKVGVGSGITDFVYSDDQLTDETSDNLTYLLTARKSTFSPKEHALFSRTYSRSDQESWDIGIRRALYELTEDFLRPFEPYLTWDLRPLRSNPFQELIYPPTLNPGDFVEQREPSGLFELVSKTRLNRIYTLFIHTATYQEWMKKELAQRRQAAEKSQMAFCLSAGPEIIQDLTLFELERGQATLDALISKSQKKEHVAILNRFLHDVKSELNRRITPHDLQR